MRLNALANGRHMLDAVLMPVLHEARAEELFHDGVLLKKCADSGHMTPAWV
jgi:NADH:ubiquinone oxidoreductase subunit E